MTTATISIALDQYLELGFGVEFPIAFDNIPFTPDGRPYLTANLLPAETTDLALQGNAAIYRGVYQVTLHYDAGLGTQEAMAAIDRITKIFANNTDIAIPGEASVFVNGHPSAFNSIRTVNGLSLPLSIPYMQCVS